jgi:peptidoglycan-N-acetylglucosamine deacetylase
VKRGRRAGIVVAVMMLVATACGQRGAPTRAAPETTTSATTATTSTTATATTTTTTTTSGSTPTSPSPPPSRTGPTTPPPSPAMVVANGRTYRKLVALTFDAGSDAGNTVRALEVLANNHIHATFGITGLWAQANPGLVGQIAASGNQIVNHSWDHQSFTGYSTETAPLTAAQITQELVRTDTLIRGLTGTGTGGWFRPPYGDRDASVDQIARAAGYRYDPMWTVDTLGWKGVPPSTVVARSLAPRRRGDHFDARRLRVDRYRRPSNGDRHR